MRRELLSAIGIGLVWLWIVALVATNAHAFVTVDHIDDTGGATLSVGQTFNVDVLVSHDGSPAINGLFTSTQWDPTELNLLNATATPFAILFGPEGFMSPVWQPAPFETDAPGTIRSVQFLAGNGQYAGVGSNVLITTLTFEVISGGDGVADISGFLNTGDTIFGVEWGGGPGGSYTLNESEYSLGSASVAITPEPGTALLLGLGLLGLARRRH